MKIHKWFSFLACMFLLGACSDDDKALGEQGVIVETLTVLETSTSSIQLQATLVSTNKVILAKRGFCYSTESNPDIYKATVIGEGNNTFEATLKELSANTIYYIRAFVSIYQGGIAYSPQITVTTFEGTNIPND